MHNTRMAQLQAVRLAHGRRLEYGTHKRAEDTQNQVAERDPYQGPTAHRLT